MLIILKLSHFDFINIVKQLILSLQLLILLLIVMQHLDFFYCHLTFLSLQLSLVPNFILIQQSSLCTFIYILMLPFQSK